MVLVVMEHHEYHDYLNIMLPLRHNYCIIVDKNRNSAYQYVSRGTLGDHESMARILIVDDDRSFGDYGFHGSLH